MSRLPRGLAYRRVAAALKRAGFFLRRQKGRHVVLRRDEPFAWVVCSAHRSIDTGTLGSIVAGAGMTLDESSGECLDLRSHLAV
ncbi:MAG: type II toxin-antitoxin system HicA family toxin [Planctomycetes bacterium]|nr:type II toxin-antitoxin system HicA family toxin [Planctomycetota bacterium]